MNLHPVLIEKLNEALGLAALPELTRREVRLPEVAGKVQAVIGMRRVGKSTFLRQWIDERKKSMAPERAIYLSFEDERLSGIGVEQLGYLLEEYFRRYPALRRQEQVAWALDEIQLVPDWERFVRRVIDSERMEIAVSGSSAKMLSKEVHTSLRGRGMATVIRPFGFREFLRHRGEEPTHEPTGFTAAERSLVEKRFLEFLGMGGFPEVQNLAEPIRIQLLQGYVETVLFRDVVERHRVSQVAALRWMVRHLLRNPAASFSVHKLHKDLGSQGLGVAKDMLHAMLSHLQDAFLADAVPLSTDSERQRNSNPRKLYPADTGLIRAYDVSGRPNVGHALECAVYHELARRTVDIGYLKTEEGWEVDFLARQPDGRQELIQVCAEPTTAQTLERELRALQSARKLHPKATCRLLVMDRDATVPISEPKIILQPAYEWMLSAP